MEDENQDPHIFQPCIGQFCINMDLLAAYTTKGSLLRFLYCHGVEIRGGVTTGQPACTDSWCYGLCIVHHVPRSPHGRFHSVTVSAFPRSVSVFTLNPRDRALSNAKVTCQSEQHFPLQQMDTLMKAPEIQRLIGSESPEFHLHSVYETTEQSAWWHKSLKTRIPQGPSV